MGGSRAGRRGGGNEEEVSDALPQGGCLEEVGRPDAFSRAGGVQVYQPLVSQVSQVLPYRCEVV